MAELTTEGLLVREMLLKHVIGAPHFAALLAKLTITREVAIGPPQITRMYDYVRRPGARDGTVATYIRLPRTLIAFCRALVKAGILTHMHVNLPAFALKPFALSRALYANQQLLVDYIMANYFTPARAAAGTATCILNLRAGMGKTFVAAGIIATLGVPTLYIVGSKYLRDQAVADLQPLLVGVPDATLYIHGVTTRGATKRVSACMNALINVYIINTAAKQTTAWFARFGLIVLDEVHAYCGAEQRAVYAVAAPYVLGLSATTDDRPDGLDCIYHREYGAPVHAVDVPGFTYENVTFACTVRVLHYYGPRQYTQALVHPRTGKISCDLMCKQFLRDPERMALAVEEIAALYNWEGSAGAGTKKHNIFVFCDQRAPLDTLAGLLTARLHLTNDDINVEDAPAVNTHASAHTVTTLRGGASETTIATAKSTARIVLTTYHYSSKGVSIDRMTAIVFLTPRKSNMKQILARIMRRTGDTSIPRVIVDITDSASALARQLTTRTRAYEFYEMKIQHKTVRCAERLCATDTTHTPANAQCSVIDDPDLEFDDSD